MEHLALFQGAGISLVAHLDVFIDFFLGGDVVGLCPAVGYHQIQPPAPQQRHKQRLVVGV